MLYKTYDNQCDNKSITRTIHSTIHESIVLLRRINGAMGVGEEGREWEIRKDSLA